MMQPHERRRRMYEKEEDLRREKEFAVELGEINGLRPIKLSTKWGLDVAMVDKHHNVKAWMEIKCRKNASTKYTDYMISLHKLLAAKRLEELTNRPAWLAVRFVDCDLIVRLNKAPFVTMYGGRWDRDDWQDWEPVAKIEMIHFYSIDADLTR